MKNRLIKNTSVCAVIALSLAFANVARAADVNAQEGKYAHKIMDLLVVRPVATAMTIGGAGLFVATLPFTALAGDSDKAEEVLVRKPARWAFSRR